MHPSFSVKTGPSEGSAAHQVTIYGYNSEIISWDQQEWIEDPSVVIAIVNCIAMGAEKGAFEVAKMVGKDWDPITAEWVERGIVAGGGQWPSRPS